MALALTVITVHGFEAENAYHRVEQIRLVAKDKIEFSVRSYKNAQDNVPAFAESAHACNYDLLGENPIKQAYEYLKTTDVFSSAIDA